jgi:predicted RNase H-like nuclease (RuvC/YqgF family)
LKQTFDVVENEKTKLKILMQSKEKKIEQKDREIDELKKKLEEKDHAVPLPNEKERHTE